MPCGSESLAKLMCARSIKGLSQSGRSSQPETLPTKDWSQYKNKAEAFKMKYNDDGFHDFISSTRSILVSAMILRCVASGASGLALRNKLFEPQKLMRGWTMPPKTLHTSVRALFMEGLAMDD